MLKILKRIAAVFCFCIAFWGCGAFLKFILIDDTESFTRLMMHELYTQEENMDVLFLGSSHCYRALNTQVTDEIFGENTFNGGSSSQGLDGSLVVLKEAAKTNEIKKVYLELYYDICNRGYKGRTNLTQTYIISDYMKPSLNRISYLLNASSSEHYGNSFILPRRNWKKLFKKDYITKLVKKKLTDEYRNYEYFADDENAYRGKGFVEGFETIEEGGFWNKKHFTEQVPEDITTTEWAGSLKEIIEFCETHEIELTLFSVPISDFTLVDVGGYDGYIEQVKQFLADTDVAYYDFNLCREKWLPLEDTCFMNADHLNGVGAERFSRVFAEFFTGQISEKELFYDSYSEKIENQNPTIYGLIVKKDKDSNSYTISPVTNSEQGEITYTVRRTPEGQEPIAIQENSPNDCVEYPDDEKGKLEIFAYLDGRETNHVKVSYGSD